MSKAVHVYEDDTSTSCLSIFDRDLANIFQSYFYIDAYDIPFIHHEHLPFNSGLTLDNKERIKKELGSIIYVETEDDPIYGLLYRRVLYFEKWDIYLRFEFQYESYQRDIHSMHIEQVYPVRILQTVYQSDPNAIDEVSPTSLEAPDLLKGL